MKQKYIRSVVRKLKVSKSRKKEIIRDLNEIFNSGLENNETEQQIIERLGSAKEFAASINEDGEKKERPWYVLIPLILSIVFFAAYALIKLNRSSDDIIGWADSTTNIQLDAAAFDARSVTFVMGIVCLIIFAVSLFIHIRKSRRNDK